MSLSTNLLAYYKLDETSGTTVVNSVGGYPNGVLSGNVSVNQTGKLNGAFRFTKTTKGSDKVSLTGFGNPATLTVSLWVKLNSNTEETYFFFGGKTAWNIIRCGVNQGGDGKFHLQLYTGSTNPVIYSDSSASTGVWTHLVYQYGASGMKMWVNGSLQSQTNSYIGTGSGAGNDKYIGSGTMQAHSPDGYIDEVGIWDRTLTNEEILTLYNGGAGSAYPFKNHNNSIVELDNILISKPNDELTIAANASRTGVNESPILTINLKRKKLIYCQNSGSSFSFFDTLTQSTTTLGLTSSLIQADSQCSSNAIYIGDYAYWGHCNSSATNTPVIVKYNMTDDTYTTFNAPTTTLNNENYTLLTDGTNLHFIKTSNVSAYTSTNLVITDYIYNGTSWTTETSTTTTYNKRLHDIYTSGNTQTCGFVQLNNNPKDIRFIGKTGSNSVETVFLSFNLYNKLDVEFSDISAILNTSSDTKYSTHLYQGKLYSPVSSGYIEVLDLYTKKSSQITLSAGLFDYRSSILVSDKIYIFGGMEYGIFNITNSSFERGYYSNYTYYSSGASVYYNNKIYNTFYPFGDSWEPWNRLQIFDMSSKTVSLVTLPTTMNRRTAQLYNGKIYMPQDGGTTLEIYDIATNTTVTKTLPTNMYRKTSQLYNGKIYMPQSGGTTLEIYDIAGDTTTTRTLPTSMERETSVLKDGILYMPGNNGRTLEIHNISANSTTTKTLPLSTGRYSSSSLGSNVYFIESGEYYTEVLDLNFENDISKSVFITANGKATYQTYNNKIYFIAHWGYIEIYDPVIDTVTLGATLTNMSIYTSQLYNGRIYIPQYDGTTLEIYDIATNTKVTRNLHVNINKITSQLYNGKIYMPQDGGTTLLIYDIEGNTTTTKTLPTNMSRWTSQLYNGKIYMPQYGGTTLEIYDIAGDTTTTKTLPTNMDRRTSILNNGKIYMPQDGGTTLEIYDIVQDTTTTKTLPTSSSRRSCNIYNGRIYFPAYYGTSLDIYDIETGISSTKTLSVSMSRESSCLYNGKLYMPQSGDGYTLEIYDIEKRIVNTPTTTDTMFTINTNFDGDVLISLSNIILYNLSTRTSITVTSLLNYFKSSSTNLFPKITTDFYFKQGKNLSVDLNYLKFKNNLLSICLASTVQSQYAPT